MQEPFVSYQSEVMDQNQDQEGEISPENTNCIGGNRSRLQTQSRVMLTDAASSQLPPTIFRLQPDALPPSTQE